MLIPLSTESWSLQALALCSDGLGTFVNEKTLEQVPLEECIAKAIDFKGPGKFVERRLRKMVTELESRGFHNLDDVAIAAMTFDEEVRP